MDNIGALGVYASLFLALYFEVFMLLTFVSARPERKNARQPKYLPTVTVLIPCWNKGDTLGATVESLLRLEYPKDKLRICIIDDGSTDHTWDTAQAYRGHPQVELLRKRNEGSKYAALNLGLRHARSELVGCLDADSFVERDALIEIVKKFEEDPKVMAVTPSLVVHAPRTLLELMQAAEYVFGVFYKKMFDTLGAVSVLPGPFSFYRRELFERIGGFRKAHHTEDMEIAFRMQERGERIANAHTAVVHTRVPQTLRALLRQRTRWSRGLLENSRDYWYMFFNPRYGHFGLFVLPLGIAASLLGLYAALYGLYGLVASATQLVGNYYLTGVPVMAPAAPDWLYVDVGVFLLVVTAAIMGIAVFAIAVGKRITGSPLPLRSLPLYFILFGLMAPLWLARALWDSAARSERGWLT